MADMKKPPVGGFAWLQLSGCLEVPRISELEKVSAWVGFLDACIGMVLQPQADFIFPLLSKQVTDPQVTGKVVARWELFVVCDVAVVGGIAHT